MADEASAHDAFADALAGREDAPSAPMPEPVAESAPQIAQDAPQGGSEPPQAPAAPNGQEAPQTPQERAQQEAMVPSWRLRELNEQREAERRQWQEDQRQLRDLREWREQQERERKSAEEKAKLDGQNFYEAPDPNAFIDQRLQHQLQQYVAPLQRQLEQMQQYAQTETQERSRVFAEQQHGADKVQAAYQRMHNAILSGDQHAVALRDRMLDHSSPVSRDPYRALMQWDRQAQLYEATGGDLEAYTKRQQDELLKNPEFLQRALEAHRQMATPVTTGVPGRAAPPQAQRTLPSLNRQTSSRDASGEGDVADVFAQTIAERGRRAG